MTKDEAKQLASDAIQSLQEELRSGHSDTLKRYLDCMSRFHNYSWTNSMLIACRLPEATLVAGFRRWLQMGRHVRKGEKGIGIMAPLIYRTKEGMSEDGDQPYSDANISGARTIRGFKMVHVFDVSQTEGEELPQLATISGNVGELLSSIESLVRANRIELKYEPLAFGVKGESRKGEIAVAESLDPAEQFAILAHELAHEWMHDLEQRKSTPKTVLETEAEAVAYVVCRSLGLDCSTRSSDYIQMYQGTEATLIASLERIQQTATRMIGAISDSHNDFGVANTLASSAS